MGIVKKNEDHLERIEKKNLNKFVENYLKMDLDPVQAYKNSFDKQLWKTEGNAKSRAIALMNDMAFIEMKNQRLDNLREIYKEEITLAFNHLHTTLKDKTFESHKYTIDPKTQMVKEFVVKENISHASKNKAAELLLKCMGYLDKQEQNVNIIHNEYQVVKTLIEKVEKEE